MVARYKSYSIQEEDTELLAFTREAAQGRLPKFVELLKFKNLTVGSKVWGCILNINSKGLSISLPDGLKGFVPIEEASLNSLPCTYLDKALCRSLRTLY